MKNRVLYSLVGLMVISLVGIIVLQSLWVSKAISEQEKEFENHVNAALNDVNANIDQEEAFFFFEDELANLKDSMGLNEFETKTKESLVISNGNRIEISVKGESTDVNFEHFSDSDQVMDDIHEALETIHVELKDEGEFGDSITIVTKKNELNRFDNISTVFRRYVKEHKFSGKLSDRISKTKLDSLLKKGLEKEGIRIEPQYAVYQSGKEKSIADFTTKKFDQKQKSSSFTKELFPNDRIIHQNFELFLQLDGTDGFVWAGIQSIVILCIVFTLLILLCFGYSLHFIFKQKRMSQVKNDFINNMTHELKTPLASISLAASSIKHPNVIGNPEEIKRFTAIIQSEEKRMNEHVERVLDMAALEYQELNMNRETAELNAIILESIEHIQLAVDAANGKVNFTSGAETATINADKFHLLSAFINILDNSVKYQDGGLEIQVKLSESHGNYELLFSDNGIGMKKSAVKQAFNKFYREETGNIHTRKGFGLGLSYVKSIIELHEGTISLTSEQDKGTNVRIKLPKA
ncbi:MAG: HAMP domain-containing sensor histidine kinase [Crocinitomicaceae bacterium]|nr:HAMP domain-containing sensor histidine kinase [Crocinitomicaceae bacterium]